VDVVETGFLPGNDMSIKTKTKDIEYVKNVKRQNKKEQTNSMMTPLK
jgi:hypothetical protein